MAKVRVPLAVHNYRAWDQQGDDGGGGTSSGTGGAAGDPCQGVVVLAEGPTTGAIREPN